MSQTSKSRRIEAESVNEGEVFQAVAAAAESLELELEPVGEVDRRMVGVFAAPAAHSAPATDPDSSDGSQAAASASSDNDEIRKALEGWASTHPEDVLEVYGQYTTSPYVAVMPGGVKTIDEAYLTQWLGSGEYQELMQTWSPKRERQPTLSNLQIVYLSDSIANATFQGRELGEGDVPVVSNGAAMLIKDPNGEGSDWKIAAISKFGDFE